MDPFVDRPARDVQAHRGPGSLEVGAGRLASSGAEKYDAPGFANDVLSVATEADFDDAVRAGERTGDSLVVSIGEISASDLLARGADSTSDSAAPPVFSGQDLAAASLNRATPGQVATVQQVPGARSGFVKGAAFALRVDVGAFNDDAKWVNIAIDVSDLDHVYGANYMDRAQLVLLPECALERPDDPDCLTALPLTFARDGLSDVVTVTAPANSRTIDSAGRGKSRGGVDVVQSGDLAAALAQAQGLKFSGTGGGTIIAAVSGAQGQTGDFTATDLAPKGTWGVSEQSGCVHVRIPGVVAARAGGPDPQCVFLVFVGQRRRPDRRIQRADVNPGRRLGEPHELHRTPLSVVRG